MYSTKRDLAVLNAKFPTAACPFCGDPTEVAASLKKDGWGGLTENGLYMVQCVACGAQGPSMKSKGEAAYEWNRLFEHQEAR